MKKIAYIFAAATAAAILLQSCEKVQDKKDVITFNTNITKAELINSLDDLKSNGFAIWCAYSLTGKFNDTQILLDRKKISWDSWRWTYDDPLEWMHVGSYKFNALYPSDYKVFKSGEKMVVDYKANREEYDRDLMLAYSFREMEGQASHTSVDLAFTHMLSAVKFVFKTSGVLPDGYKMKFKDIGISEVVNEARLSFTDGSSKWENDEESRDTVKYAQISDEKWLSVIPQSISPEANVFFTVESGSDEIGWVSAGYSRILSKDQFNKWEKGKRYTYTITIDTSCDIDVEISECDWDDVECETPEIIIR